MEAAGAYIIEIITTQRRKVCLPRVEVLICCSLNQQGLIVLSDNRIRPPTSRARARTWLGRLGRLGGLP